jgi:hypothetical protein
MKVSQASKQLTPYGSQKERRPESQWRHEVEKAAIEEDQLLLLLAHMLDNLQ